MIIHYDGGGVKGPICLINLCANSGAIDTTKERCGSYCLLSIKKPDRDCEVHLDLRQGISSFLLLSIYSRRSFTGRAPYGLWLLRSPRLRRSLPRRSIWRSCDKGAESRWTGNPGWNTHRERGKQSHFPRAVWTLEGTHNASTDVWSVSSWKRVAESGRVGGRRSAWCSSDQGV